MLSSSSTGKKNKRQFNEFRGKELDLIWIELLSMPPLSSISSEPILSAPFESLPPLISISSSKSSSSSSLSEYSPSASSPSKSIFVSLLVRANYWKWIRIIKVFVWLNGWEIHIHNNCSIGKVYLLASSISSMVSSRNSSVLPALSTILTFVGWLCGCEHVFVANESQPRVYELGVSIICPSSVNSALKPAWMLPALI